MAELAASPVVRRRYFHCTPWYSHEKRFKKLSSVACKSPRLDIERVAGGAKALCCNHVKTTQLAQYWTPESTD
jgi:hypothetical protein